ncbi:MAG TPA: PTS sugar transporter subunit IIA [Vicinamibacteria bacterium]|nr:PTS sugar transporter subunit IIA [Vicinamibacteria bacterium]
MIGIVVVTHGQLARELVAAAEIIVGDLPNVTAVSIGWHESPEDAQKEIEDAVGRVESGKGVVVLTDMFGGTPSNLSLTLLEKGRLEVVTGVNLPMLIRLASLREEEEGDDLHAVAAEAARDGKDSIYLASDLLASQDRERRENRDA